MSKALAAFDRGFPGPLAGVDEVGRGPIAGPVVAAAVVLPESGWPEGIRDSKKLSAKAREWLDGLIRGCAAVGVAVVGPEEVDRLNIHHATLAAMARAVAALPVRPAHVLVDGKFLPRLDIPATALVGGDAKSLSVAAASIVAKVLRDRIMVEAAESHPEFGWSSNKGYPSPEHVSALKRHGPSPLHRRSFAPVAAQILTMMQSRHTPTD
ncbi:ribonuclease HII [Sphingomonas lenta]|uniref:Ribonuclease HII n=1 Tax=Sphingomonas lenta TaxID=1141887 RepID=A0A2A2SEN7_9SPHN|nr:ribonuclease HII [Sphingomonas lenta]PAX07665.1 ribonuclease HII [Sphingomonas lenta]